MTTFPALQPGSRAFIPGTYPGATFRTLSGRDSRVRHSNAVVAMQAKAEFPLLSESQLESIRSHYVGQYGGHKPFAVPDEFWSGANTPAGFTPSGYQWRYAGKPSIEEITIDTSGAAATLFTVSIELEAVPLSAVVLSGATFNITTSWLPGYKAVSATGATWDVAVAWVPGGSSTWGPGVDPYFANVSLLLKMEGVNGSTSFVDSSSNNVSLTSNGAVITTANKKFGASAGQFGSTAGSRLSTSALNTLLGLGAGDFTIEYFEYVTSAVSAYDVVFDYRSGGGFPAANPLISLNTSRLYDWSGTTVATSPITLNQWQHIAWVRSGSVVTLYIDGVASGSFTSTTNYSCALFTIGAANDDPTGFYSRVILDELRITKGIARYTANFTSPTAAFPTA